MGAWGSWPLKLCRSQCMFWPLKCHIFFIQNCCRITQQFHIMKDERPVSQMEGKTNFSRRMKQFDGLTWLTLTPVTWRQIYTTSQYASECAETCLSMVCRSAVVAKSRTMRLSVAADSRVSSWRSSRWQRPTSRTRSPSIWMLTPSRFSAECICSMFARPARQTRTFQPTTIWTKCGQCTVPRRRCAGGCWKIDDRDNEEPSKAMVTRLRFDFDSTAIRPR